MRLAENRSERSHAHGRRHPQARLRLKCSRHICISDYEGGAFAKRARSASLRRLPAHVAECRAYATGSGQAARHGRAAPVLERLYS